MQEKGRAVGNLLPLVAVENIQHPTSQDVTRKKAMAEKTQHHETSLMTRWKATLFEFPLVRAKWGVGKEQEIAEAARRKKGEEEVAGMSPVSREGEPDQSDIWEIFDIWGNL
jgi:hypothetical protein